MAGANTHQKAALKHKRVNIDILEFGSVLFHPGSPVLMPSIMGDEEGCIGIKALGAVFKQHEFDSRKRIIVAGHTDSEDSNKFDGSPYDLAEARAKSVLYLLTGDINWWSRRSKAYHLICDYKRILQHFHTSRWHNCYPGAADDTWNAKTLAATRQFIENFNTDCDGHLDPGLADAVENDANHKWPFELWKTVYSLYVQEMCDALGIRVNELPALRRKRLSYVKRNYGKYVACGESFPLDGKEDQEKNGYNQEKKRRVEVLFFYKGEGPGLRKGLPSFKCAAAGNAKHVAKECPLWYPGHLKATYLDPAFEIEAIAFHLVFAYYDKTREKILRVPGGLPIKTYYYTNIADRTTKTAIDARVSCQDGYYVVKFRKAANQDNVFFEFETPDPADNTKKSQWWVVTLDKDKDSEIEKITQFSRLMREDLQWRFKYYDLPKEWCSENYWTRYKEGSGYKADRYLEAAKDKLKLKPFPGQSGTTTVDKPLFFSLDDIVLVKADGNQEVKDKSWDKNGPPWNEADNDLMHPFSQFSIFHVKDGDLVLHKPKYSKAPYYSDVAFKKGAAKAGINLITDVPPHTRLVVFANQFYSVFEKRAGQDGWPVDFTKKQIKGCRAACPNESRYHHGMTLNANAGPGHNRYFAAGCGNFELHYVHHGCVIKKPEGLESRSFVVICWNGYFVANNVAGSSDTHTVVDADLDKFARDGLMNVKERWEKKGYTIEPHFDENRPRRSYEKIQIKPVFFFERKEKQKDADTGNDVCLGGAPKCKVNITNDTGAGDMSVTESNMYYPDYKIRDYLKVGASPKDIDGMSFKGLTVSHELGHAEGKDDEYSYEDGDVGSFFYNAQDHVYSQYYLGMPYQIDTSSMMVTNRAPRMKHLWYFLNRLNDAAADPNALRLLLGGTEFEMVHRFSRNPKIIRYRLPLIKADPAAVPPIPNDIDYRDFCKPYKDTRTPAMALANTGTGSLDLGLYKMGPDELAWSLRIKGKKPKGLPFDGILAVFVKIWMDFPSGTDASGTAHNWGDPGEPKDSIWLSKLKKELTLNERFYLQSTRATQHFKNTCLFFFPVILDEYWVRDHARKPVNQGGMNLSGAALTTHMTNAENAAHYKLEVELNHSTSVTRTAASELEVGSHASQRWVARYILGANGGLAADGNSVNAPLGAKIGKGDLTWIRNWLRAQLNDNTFEIQERINF